MGNLYGLIGYPVSHSLSAVMHNEEFKQLQLPHYYHLFNVAPKDLEEAIRALRLLGVSGFNITIPHKENIIPFLDEIDEEAKHIGAVNTVKNENGRLIGYNTDGKGFVLSLKQILPEQQFSGQSILIVGAGGGARGIFVSLQAENITQLDVANRTLSKAETLIEQCAKTVNSQALSLQEGERVLGNYDIVINTTSVGMRPNINETPIALNNLGQNKILCDIIYNPQKTRFLQEGQEKYNATILNGVGMLAGQGALAFEIWTGQKPNLERMIQTVQMHLGGQ